MNPIRSLTMCLIASASISLLNPIMIIAQTPSQDAASDSADIDIIRENVKQRIRQTVQGNPQVTDSSLAYSGKLTSIANETLTIDTLTGIKLASTSAETVYLQKNNQEESPAQANDLAIDTYIVAMGYINGSQVLDTRKIIIHNSSPTPPDNQTAYGLVTSYDKQNDTVTINNPFTNQSVTGIISDNTDYFEASPEGNTTATDQDAIIVNQSYALVVYLPGEATETNSIQSILLNNLNTTQENILSATDSAQTELPPEIQ